MITVQKKNLRAAPTFDLKLQYIAVSIGIFSIEASEIATDKLNPIKDIALQSPAIRMFRSAASKNTLFQKSFGPISLRLEVDLDENQVDVIFGKCGRMANARKEVPIDTFGRIFERVVEYRGI